MNLAGQEGDYKFILAHTKYEMFIGHQSRDILLVSGNFGLELRET